MRPTKLATSLTAAVVTIAGLAYAGDELTSLSYISYLERFATVQPANGQKTVDAVVNMPLVTGDRIDTARGARVEVQLADGSTLWVDEFTTLDFDALAASREEPAERTVLFIQEGTAAVEIPATALGGDTVRLDYPNGTLFLSKPGFYRFDLRSGKLHVQAHAGLAELPAGIGSALLRTGQEAWLDNADRMETSAIPAQADDFWAWVQERRNPTPAARTAEMVGTTTAGRTAALDSYGTWVYVDAYSSWAWRPYVQVGWTPYSHGRWYWTAVGWNWISYEPWGWYPYHYGSWYWDASFGWGWCWDRVWGPAWVHWMYTPGYIGWCPRGYYDYWYYGHGYHYGGGYPGGGYPGGGHPGGPGRPVPARWSENALDFSGHVRLRDVDPRPWNMVPANQFTNARLDRVRVEPGRVLADAGDDARAHVRSGPLVTAPSRGDVERDFDADYRGRSGRSGVTGSDDLGTIFGRDDQSVRAIPAGTSVRAVRTADLVTATRRRTDASGDPGGAASGAGSGFTTPGDRPTVDMSGSPRSARSGVGSRTAAPASPNSAGGSRTGRDTTGTTPTGTGGTQTAPRSGNAPAREPASAPRSVTPPASGTSSTAPRSRAVQPAPSGSSAAPAPASPPSPSPAPASPKADPPAARRPGYASRVRSYVDRIATESGSSWSRSETSSTPSSRTYVVPFAGGRRVVQVTSPGATGAAATAGQQSATASSRGAYAQPSQPRAATTSGSSPAPAARSVGAPARSYQPSPSGGSSAGRSYQSSPSGGSSPRSVSAPSGGSAPRSAPSSGGSSRSSGGSSSAGSRPSGRR